MGLPTVEQVAAVYAARDAAMQDLKKALAAYDEKQIAAEKYMLSANPGIDDIAAIYVARRSEAAELEKRQKEIKVRQEAFEQWFGLRLAEIGAESTKTLAGTIYKYRAESVTVAEWDTFVEQNLLAPAALAVASALAGDTAAAAAEAAPFIEQILRESMNFSLLNHAVNKTEVLTTCMGDFNDKTKSRPNPPPAGVNYTAVMKVGVRKS
jgi:hypothetical protein